MIRIQIAFHRMCGHTYFVNLSTRLCILQIVSLTQFLQPVTESLIVQHIIRRFSKHFRNFVRRITNWDSSDSDIPYPVPLIVDKNIVICSGFKFLFIQLCITVIGHITDFRPVVQQAISQQFVFFVLQNILRRKMRAAVFQGSQHSNHRICNMNILAHLFENSFIECAVIWQSLQVESIYITMEKNMVNY